MINEVQALNGSVSATQTLNGNVYAPQTLSGTAKEKGERGLSAYEVYVKNGGTLSEKEWLESLNGEPGVNDAKELYYEDDYGYGTPNNIQDALDFAFEELDNRILADDVYNNYVSCTTAQNLSTTKQSRARSNIGIPQTCIMYNQVQNLSNGYKGMARANIGVRGFTNLGEIDLSDYDDDVFTFIDTLTEEGTYKFTDNIDYFTYIVETWWLGDYNLGQKYFYEEEGYSYQYYRNGYYDEDNDEYSWDDWIYYMTDAIAIGMFAQRSHVHFTTINTPNEIRAYLDSITNYNLKDLRVISSTNKHIYMVRVDYTNYTISGSTKYVRYQEYYDIEEPNKIYKRKGLANGSTTASKITWEDWQVFESSNTILNYIDEAITGTLEGSY